MSLFLGTQSQLIALVAQVKEQNKEILAILKKNNPQSAPRYILPDNIPVQLPVTTQEELNVLEDFIQDKENLFALVSLYVLYFLAFIKLLFSQSLYLSTLGSRDRTSQTNNVLRHLITDKVACTYSFRGTRKEKKAFHELLINKVVIRK